MTQTATHTPWRVEDCVLPLDSSLERAMTAENFRAIASNTEWQQIEIAHCRVDPWYWRINYVVTMNEHWVTTPGWTGPYRRWPATEHSRSYLHVLFTEMFTAWPKSRQQMATWLIASQMYGDAIFTGGRLYMIQSKQHVDSMAVLERVRGIDQRLRTLAPWLVPALTKDDAREMRWANESTMCAVPEGPNYVQSRTPAWWLADEIQLQVGAKEALKHAIPACERISLVGTADYGYFYQEFLPEKEVA